MTLDYNNPNDWGKSPLTDNALRLQQFRAENPEKWNSLIEDDLNALTIGEPIVTPDPLIGLFEEEEEPYPPFTGTEYVANNDTIDNHPCAAAFGQFLGNGIDPDAANELAFGINSLHLISDDYEDPLRVRAHNIFERFNDMNYWRDSGETDREPEDFTFE